MASKPANIAGFRLFSQAGNANPRIVDLALLALLRVLVSALVFALGFRAVSDDDFARVVIAQEWAASPKLDPSGTSWLPLPFWMVGLAMRAFSSHACTAYAVAALLGVLSTFLVHTAALWITNNRRISFIGAAVATILPWSARLGIATVPELFASALALLALASTVPPAPPGFPLLGSRAPRLFLPTPWPLPNRMLIGASCLAASTLCRYDAWPIAAAFALFAAACACAPRAHHPSRLRYAMAALLALSAPALWIAWNHHAHGSAFHFLERVAAYRRALGGADHIHPLRSLFAYPEAFVRHEPELFGVLLILSVAALAPRTQPPHLRAHLGRYARPAAFFILQLALLSAAMVRDGAPTHHAERALLTGMLLLSLISAELWQRLHAHLFTQEPPSASPQRLLNLVLLVWIIPAALLMRPWIRREHFAERSAETAIGKSAAALVQPGERILLEVNDYGYFAVIAAFARPSDIVLDKSADPRTAQSQGSLGEPKTLAERLQKDHIRYIIARAELAPSIPAKAIAQAGKLALFGPIPQAPAPHP